MGRLASVKISPFKVEELFRVKLYLEILLSRIIVLVNHHIFQHRVLVLDFIVDLLVQIAHSIVRVTVACAGWLLLVICLKEYVRQTRLVTMLTCSQHYSDPFILIRDNLWLAFVPSAALSIAWATFELLFIPAKVHATIVFFFARSIIL